MQPILSSVFSPRAIAGAGARTRARTETGLRCPGEAVFRCRLEGSTAFEREAGVRDTPGPHAKRARSGLQFLRMISGM